MFGQIPTKSSWVWSSTFNKEKGEWRINSRMLLAVLDTGTREQRQFFPVLHLLYISNRPPSDVESAFRRLKLYVSVSQTLRKFVKFDSVFNKKFCVDHNIVWINEKLCGVSLQVRIKSINLWNVVGAFLTRKIFICIRNTRMEWKKRSFLRPPLSSLSKPTNQIENIEIFVQLG